VGRKTIADRGDRRAIETLKDIGGDRPVGSYLGFLQDLEAAQVSFVTRLNQGTHPKFQDSEGREVAGPESGLSGRGAQGVVGLWERGHAEPLGTGEGPGDVPPTDEDRCDLPGPEGPDESVGGSRRTVIQGTGRCPYPRERMSLIKGVLPDVVGSVEPHVVHDGGLNGIQRVAKGCPEPRLALLGRPSGRSGSGGIGGLIARLSPGSLHHALGYSVRR
jgi:hypothetical protein